MITIWRRHTDGCEFKKKGRAYIKCTCPIWADGYADGRRVFRQSLHTRDMARARTRAGDLESSDTRPTKLVSEAADAYIANCESSGLQTSSVRKYLNVVTQLKTFCKSKDIRSLNELTVEALDAYRATRSLSPLTATKELETLRMFLGFCVARKWIDDNPAKRIKSPRKVKPKEVVPFTPDELKAIFAACDRVGQSAYERARALGMVSTLRYTALRIGDVSTLARDRISRDGTIWRIFLHTEKTGQPVFLPVPPDMKAALDVVPIPEGTVGESRHFFWSGNSAVKTVKAGADRTLRAVFKVAGLKDAHPHKFRHTLATELLGRGATFEEVADILGNSPEVVRKHYAKWSRARQSRIDELMNQAYFGMDEVENNRPRWTH